MTKTIKKTPSPPGLPVRALTHIHRSAGISTDQDNISAAAEIHRHLVSAPLEERFAVNLVLMDGICSPSSTVKAKTALTLGFIIKSPEFPTIAQAERVQYLAMARISAAGLKEDLEPRNREAGMRLANGIPLR
jgi:hypothetical protein